MSVCLSVCLSVCFQNVLVAANTQLRTRSNGDLVPSSPEMKPTLVAVGSAIVAVLSH